MTREIPSVSRPTLKLMSKPMGTFKSSQLEGQRGRGSAERGGTLSQTDLNRI